MNVISCSFHYINNVIFIIHINSMFYESRYNYICIKSSLVCSFTDCQCTKSAYYSWLVWMWIFIHPFDVLCLICFVYLCPFLALFPFVSSVNCLWCCGGLVFSSVALQLAILIGFFVLLRGCEGGPQAFSSSAWYSPRKAAEEGLYFANTWRIL